MKIGDCDLAELLEQLRAISPLVSMVDGIRKMHWCMTITSPTTHTVIFVSQVNGWLTLHQMLRGDAAVKSLRGIRKIYPLHRLTLSKGTLTFRISLLDEIDVLLDSVRAVVRILDQ